MPKWSFDQVLPYYRKVEDDPVGVALDDLNAPGAEGVGAVLLDHPSAGLATL